jgi:hypothetical protein
MDGRVLQRRFEHGRRLHLHHTSSYDEVAALVSRLVPNTWTRVAGRDSRPLRVLVAVASDLGLELRDQHGHLEIARERLVGAHGYTRHNARIRQRWCVELGPPARTVPESAAYLIEAIGDGDGARITFSGRQTVDLLALSSP